MYPRLKILTSKEFDKVICGKFINRQKAGIDFGEGIIKVHPFLASARNKDPEDASKIISKYFDDYYSKFDAEIIQAIKKIRQEWSSKETDFFRSCDIFFNKHLWPEGKYESYLSIISCNPRFLEDKTFQFYWKNKYGFVYIAVHEMLHFIFYDLIEQLLPNLDIKSEQVWNISEIFNGLIMAEEEFVDITAIKEPHQYPGLLEMQEELTTTWKKKKNARDFILSTLS